MARTNCLERNDDDDLRLEHAITRAPWSSYGGHAKAAPALAGSAEVRMVETIEAETY